jgi:predicted nucleic acid-binding protein
MKERDSHNRFFVDPMVITYLVERGDNFKSVFFNLKGIGPLSTDVKALQEIVYWYHLLGETAKGYEYAILLREHASIHSIGVEELETQEQLLTRYPLLSPRELLHAAVMLNNKLEKVICSPDSGYDQIDEIEVQQVLGRLSERY